MEVRPTQSRSASRGLSRRLTGGFAAGITALALVAGSLPAVAQTAPADAPNPPHPANADGKHRAPMTKLTVTGDGTSTAQPDQATISLGVTVQADTAGKAMSENATRQQTVIDKLKEQGIEAKDIQTSGLSLSPVQSYSQDGKPPVITGYMAQNMVTVRIRDLAKLGPTLDALVEAGANEINGVSFTREDSTEAEDAARVDAVKSAHRKAEVLAGAAGMKVGRLISLDDGAVSSGPRPMMMMAARDAKAGSTPIEAGELSVYSSVTATYELLPADGN